MYKALNKYFIQHIFISLFVLTKIILIISVLYTVSLHEIDVNSCDKK